MAQESAAQNPFMLMMHPEVVLAAIEKSERLSQLNRHLCRPLDRPTPLQPGETGAGGADARFGSSDDRSDSPE